MALVLALVLGMALGQLNGFLVTTLGLHSLVLTIGTTGIYGGAILMLTKGVAITGIPEGIQFPGRGDVLDLPVPLIIMLLVLAAALFLTTRTPMGRYMYAIGNNAAAARMLGIRVGRIRLLVFTFAGMLSALAGLLMVARLGTAQPSIGQAWVLAPIAASVIGGVATTGGVSSPLGAIFGAGLIAIIENIIVLFGVSPIGRASCPARSGSLPSHSTLCRSVISAAVPEARNRNRYDQDKEADQHPQGHYPAGHR
ncbi:ABC transporter permease [Paracoccus rhizosphaerae]|uniref:ABC transporter permease n=1 Tax=Paracoccus rhizosphaerae TaxID=1133347 RepID=A0ABV6CES5_9RHOB|nr:ABC transporter permease [Paracoccus rhizosphaerae]